MIGTFLGNSIHSNISNSRFTSTSGLVTLPLLPGHTFFIPPIFITEMNSYGQYYFGKGTRQQPRSDSRSIASVSLYWTPRQRRILDASGQKINLLIGQMLQVIMILISWPILMTLISFNNTFFNPRGFRFSSMISVTVAMGSSNNSR